MIRMKVVYVAHQYGGDQANRAAAAKWCVFFAEQGFAPSAAWIVLTSEWDESMRGAGLLIDFEFIRRSDCLVMVGPSQSAGMLSEAYCASVAGVPLVNASEQSEFPATPAELTPEQALALVRAVRNAS